MDRINAVIDIAKKIQPVLQDRRVRAGVSTFQMIWNGNHPILENITDNSNPLECAADIVDSIILGNDPQNPEHWLTASEVTDKKDDPLNVIVGWREMFSEKLSNSLLKPKGVKVALTAYSVSKGTTNDESQRVVRMRDPELIQDLLWSNPSLLPKEAETYRLEDYSHNVMLIFNHTHVWGFPHDRDSTHKDVKDLRNTFEPLNFIVDECTDNTKDQLFKNLKDCVNWDFTDVGCIAIVILSHGQDGGLIFAKDDTYHESELKAVFHESKNKTLFGKPVLLFIQIKLLEDRYMQACRSGTLTTDSRDMGDYRLPVQADMLTLHSTYSGQPSFRDADNGTWFIQELCRAIREFEHEDLQSIIVRLLRSIAYYKEHAAQHDGNTVIFKQIPECTTTITRKLFLKRRQNARKPSLEKPRSSYPELSFQTEECD